MREETLTLINARLQHAVQKHPDFAPEGVFQAVSVVGEEYGEFAQAVNDGDLKKAVDEALDGIVTFVRFIEEAA